MSKTRIAIFASGTGSNAVNLINYFRGHDSVEVAFVLSNKHDAPILKSASDLGINVMDFTNDQVADGSFLIDVCQNQGVDWIILAGYLRLIPLELIHKYNHRMINLHPSLLPKYGGRGMYGRFVHNAVLSNKEKESGITIHYVNEHFDEGNVIAQLHCELDESETVDSLEGKIRRLEQKYLPFVIEQTILQ